MHSVASDSEYDNKIAEIVTEKGTEIAETNQSLIL